MFNWFINLFQPSKTKTQFIKQEPGGHVLVGKPKPIELPEHEECKEKHPLKPSQWSVLQPGFPSGQHEVCTVTTGYYKGSLVRCNASKFVPSPRCNCREHIYYKYRPFDGQIIDGICTICECVVSGHEDEADTWACNW